MQRANASPGKSIGAVMEVPLLIKCVQKAKAFQFSAELNLWRFRVIEITQVLQSFGAIRVSLNWHLT
jgi:hypothetical protein